MKKKEPNASNAYLGIRGKCAVKFSVLCNVYKVQVLYNVLNIRQCTKTQVETSSKNSRKWCQHTTGNSLGLTNITPYRSEKSLLKGRFH